MLDTSTLVPKNPDNLPVDEILKQMNEPRPLPMGMEAFEVWSDRIIAGAMIPLQTGDNLIEEHARESQKFALATMLMHLPPTTDHECDGYFIKSLRKSAINQIAHAKMESIRNAAKARLRAQEEAEKAADT